MDSKRKHSPSDQKLSRDDVLNAIRMLEQKITTSRMNEESQIRPESEGVNSQPRQAGREHNYIDEPDLIQYIREAAKDLLHLVDQNASLSYSQLNGNQSIHQPQTKGQRMKSAVNRLYEGHEKKLQKIATLKTKKEERELETIKARPSISPNSRKIVETKQLKPIHKRIPDIINTKEENMNKIRMIEEEKRREIERQEFQPDIRVTNRSRQRARNVDEMTENFHKWQMKKVSLQQERQYEIIRQEMEDLTFKPTISEYSKRLAQNYLADGEAVEDRLLRSKYEHQEKLKILRDQQKPAFQPYLSAKSRVLAQNIKIKESSRYDRDSDNQSYIDFISDFQYQPKPKSTMHKRSETPVFISKVSTETIYSHEDNGTGKVFHTFM